MRTIFCFRFKKLFGSLCMIYFIWLNTTNGFVQSGPPNEKGNQCTALCITEMQAVRIICVCNLKLRKLLTKLYIFLFLFHWELRIFTHFTQLVPQTGDIDYYSCIRTPSIITNAMFLVVVRSRIQIPIFGYRIRNFKKLMIK